MKIVYLSIIVLIIDILMIRRKAFGYAMGLGLLFLLSALFFSLICIIPFGLFVKGLKGSVSTQ